MHYLYTAQLSKSPNKDSMSKLNNSQKMLTLGMFGIYSNTCNNKFYLTIGNKKNAIIEWLINGTF